MRKLLIIITVIILAFAFFYSCTIPIEKTNNDEIEKPGPETDPEPEPYPWEQIPFSPENLRITTVTHDTIVISWDAVSNAYKYKIVYGDEQEDITYEIGFGIALLNSDTGYRFQVFSGNFRGWSWVPSEIVVRTDEAYGDVKFRGGYYVAQGGSCIIYIDGQFVGRSQYGGRSTFTTNHPTGWRFMEVQYWHPGEPFQYKSIWFYLTTEGITINFDDL